MGGIRYANLNKIAKDIWEWCETRHLWIFASYVPSKENTEADAESRKINIDTEWEVEDAALKKKLCSVSAHRKSTFLLQELIGKLTYSVPGIEI